jgi:branched-chain amino acid transport system substrate-binding protein
VAVAGILALTVSGCSSGSNAAAGSTGTIKIGLVAALSGVYQSVGVDIRDGFQLYLDTHGGQLGGHRVDVKVADGGEGAKTAQPAAQKLIKSDHVLALTGLVAGDSVAAVAQLSTAAHIPLIGSNARPDLKDITWVWTTSYMSADPGAAIAGYIHDTTGNGKVYAIGPDYQGGWDELRGFTDAWKGLDGKLANEDGKTTWTPFPATTNYLPYLSKIPDSGAKAVYTFYAGGAAIDFVKQYAQSDAAAQHIPLYAAGFLTEGVLPAEGAAAGGVYTVLNYSPDLDNAANRTFVADWTKAGHNAPPTTYAMASYDAATVLDHAIASIKGPVTSAAINTALGKLGNIDSPRGPWQFNSNHAPAQKWYLRRVQNDGRALSNVLLQTLTTEG